MYASTHLSNKCDNYDERLTSIAIIYPNLPHTKEEEEKRERKK